MSKHAPSDGSSDESRGIETALDISLRFPDLHPDEMEQVRAFVDEVREAGSV